MTPASLWARLAAAGVAVGAQPPAHDAAAPWYVRLMLGIAGCIAAGFLIGFVGVGLRVVWESKAGSVAGGLAMIGAAYALFRAGRGDFGSMFGFAVSVAGQALLAVGLFRILDTDRGAAEWAVMATVEASLAILMPNTLHRLASAFAAAVFLALALQIHGASDLVPGIIAAAVAALWLNELRAAQHRRTIAPVAYGLTLALVFIEAEFGDRSLAGFFGARTPWTPPWLGEGLMVGALLAVVIAVARRAGWALREPRMLLTIAAAAAIGTASFKAPGVAAGLMIVLLGFANGNRVLTGAGIAALLFYVSKYYYLLEVTLLVKSGVLAATGVALLAARWLMLNVLLPEGSKDA
jgi:hypothetical protein